MSSNNKYKCNKDTCRIKDCRVIYPCGVPPTPTCTECNTALIEDPDTE